jgi:hypothetical protein
VLLAAEVLTRMPTDSDSTSTSKPGPRLRLIRGVFHALRARMGNCLGAAKVGVFPALVRALADHIITRTTTNRTNRDPVERNTFTSARSLRFYGGALGWSRRITCRSATSGCGSRRARRSRVPAAAPCFTSSTPRSRCRRAEARRGCSNWTGKTAGCWARASAVLGRSTTAVSRW